VRGAQIDAQFHTDRFAKQAKEHRQSARIMNGVETVREGLENARGSRFGAIEIVAFEIQKGLEAALEAALDLTHTLAADAEAVADLLQRRRIFRE